MNRSRTHSHTLAVVTLHAALAVWSLSASAQPAPCNCPQADAPPPVPSKFSPVLPADVCIPTRRVDNGACIPVTPAEIPFAFFDDFSWRSFVALIWPALEDQRGAPDPDAQPGEPGPLVFETFKHDWELFQPNGAAPAAWSSYAGTNPCNVANLKYGDLVLAAFSKYSNVGQADFGFLVGPLPAQPAQPLVDGTGEYTRYLTGFNQVEFDQIVKNRWYISSNQTNVSFAADARNNNPIDVKSAWRVITPGIDTSRYYTRKAYVYDLVSSQCSERTVALVGLHIVTKTPSRSQWVWSTFMQIDAVPGTPGAAGRLGYNNGTGVAMPATNPIPYPPPAQGFPFNVTQVKQTASSTQATSAAYQNTLAKLGSGVWQYYTLVMTQWPIRTYSQDDGSPANTFPGTGATTAFANPLLETFDQNDISTGCMSCHDIAAGSGGTDFLWSLALNAYPPPSRYERQSTAVPRPEHGRARPASDPAQEVTRARACSARRKKIGVTGRGRPGRSGRRASTAAMSTRVRERSSCSSRCTTMVRYEASDARRCQARRMA